MMSARRLIMGLVPAVCVLAGILALTSAPAQAAGLGEIGSFGPKGPGSSNFAKPESVAVEQSNGDVYVLDAGTEAIYKFNGKGEEATFSSTGAHEIKEVSVDGKGASQIAVDSSSGPDKGDIYVATGERVLIFNSAGEELKPLIEGEEPLGVAVDPSGAVYVAFGRTHSGYVEPQQIRKYTPVTNPVTAADHTCSLSTVEKNRDIAADDPEGYIYEVDSSPGLFRFEASKCGPERTKLHEGEAGMPVVDAAFEGNTLAVDPASGDVYVNRLSGHIAVYTPAGGLVEEFGSLTESSYGVAVSDASAYKGDVYVPAGEEGSKVIIFGSVKRYPLDVHITPPSGGTVECEVKDGTPEPCAPEYDEGEVVTLVETPAFNYTFKDWSEACSGTGPTCVVTMTGPMSVTAEFALSLVKKYPLEVHVMPPGGGTVDCRVEGGAPKACAPEYDEGTEVELVEAPSQGYTFAGWSEACSGAGAKCVVRMTGPVSVTATFVLTAYALEVHVTPSGGGTVECRVDGGSTGSCASNYPEGTKVELVEAPGKGYAFAGWSEACSEAGAGETCVVVMTGPKSVTALFATAAPAVSDEAVSKVTATSATFSAQIDPEHLLTAYHFEYDTTPYTTSAQHGTSLPVPGESIGEGLGDLAVSEESQALRSDMTYHYRVVAVNAFGVTDGPEHTFTTQTAGEEFTLPDGREYEMVSPPNKHAAVIQAITENYGTIQAAEDGGAIAYAAQTPIVSDPPSNLLDNAEVLSVRGPAGWSSLDIGPSIERVSGEETGDPDAYKVFSPDLSLGLVEPSDVTLLSSEASEYTPYLRVSASCETTPEKCYLPLVTAMNIPPGTKFGGEAPREPVWGSRIRGRIVRSPSHRPLIPHTADAVTDRQAE